MLPILLLALLWEHSGLDLDGFSVEQSYDLLSWQQIGYVIGTNVQATYRFELTNTATSFYRVAAL